MPKRITGALLALLLLGSGACQPAPDNEENQGQGNAAAKTEEGVEPAKVPPPPGTDTLMGDTVRR